MQKTSEWILIMERYTLKEAQHQLKRLLDEAQSGKQILILDDHDRAVQLIPVVTVTQPRKAGTARGQIQVGADFDAPLTDFDEYMA
jgi:antitoxin (DNA-binding transcriptional repressor) of toxin-antitoxin stability system